MNHDQTMLDALAALAVGALPASEGPAAREHLSDCQTCRDTYREFSAATDTLIVAAAAESPTLSPDRASALKSRVLAAVVRQSATRESPKASGFARIALRDAVLPFAPGIDWVVVPAAGMTLVYWYLQPPRCGTFPMESHPQMQAGLVLEGAMDMHFRDGPSQRIHRGEMYAISPGTWHAASFEERTVLFETYSPNYREFEDRYAASAGR